jgi:hypothetical protein
MDAARSYLRIGKDADQERCRLKKVPMWNLIDTFWNHAYNIQDETYLLTTRLMSE